MNYDQRVLAEAAWLGAAIEWVRAHPDADVAGVIIAIPNPHDLLIRPPAGVAVAVAGRDQEAEKRRKPPQ